MTIDWILGFVWGVGTISDSRLYIRYKDETLLENIAISLGIKGRPFHPTEGKTGLRMQLNDPFAQKLLSLGWSGRMDADRKYPVGDFDEIEFIRGYCHTKSTVDTINTHRKNGFAIILRLRIYGSLNIVESIDLFFQRIIETTPKKPHLIKTNTGQCWCLYYQSQKEVPLITEILHIKERTNEQN